MATYRNASGSRRWIRRLGIVIDPGEAFESPFEINDGNFELVEETKNKRPAAPVKEDR